MSTLLVLRRALLGVTVLGLLGLGAELIAVGHWYAAGQLIPFIAVLGTVLASLFYLVFERRWTTGGLRLVSLLLILTGLYGALEHHKAQGELRSAGRANQNAAPPEQGARPLFGLPEAGPNALNGPAPLSAPLAMSGLGVLLFLSLYRREEEL
jgi:hypothetical protein